ncbi:ABC transporter permease [Streptomyces rishiriensis]|uniref:ABC transporter n=1 Tax=Streptomyces rishiriensis TaxID=68264 RepID=A0ABU0NT63_STRRH|nr:ABC transporter permease [Streptomyces rishiriensis]MDQ0581918.1 hypothetical protein [Streptomyces rishiriensis]
MTALAPSPTLSETTRTTPGAGWLLRLHRPALYLWIGAVAVLAVVLLWLGGPLTDSAATAWREYDKSCDTGGSCRYDQDSIVRYKDVYAYTTAALTALPFVVAAWAGAALFGRELEHGTAQLAWTQNLSPTRWLTTKLIVPAVLVTAGTGLLVALHRVMWTAGDGRIDTADAWYANLTLHANGPTTVAFALTGLAGGALAGVLLRRTLPALTLALACVAALRFLADQLMPHLWPAVTQVTSLADGYRGSGLNVDSGLVTATGAHIADPGCGSTIVAGCKTVYADLDATGFYTTYHPESHYWPLQLTTTALVLAVAAALAVTAFVLLKRSTAAPARVRTEAAA